MEQYAPYDIPKLLEQIRISGPDVGEDDGEARRACLKAARTLVYALEKPMETICRNTWAEV